VDGVLQPRFSAYSVGIPLSTGPHVVKCLGRISESADCTCEDSETINVAAIGRPFVVLSTGIVYFRLLNFSFFHLCCATTYVGEIKLYIYIVTFLVGWIAEWLACWTQEQQDLGSNRTSDAVG